MWREKGEIFIKLGTIVCVYHRSSLKIATETRVIIGNKNSGCRLISIMISLCAPVRQRGGERKREREREREGGGGV